ncbi:MAG TPA: sigma-70 family RNA polymerase sigma factor, partial [Acidimicrobiales bacterium]|nr:sigma-70 family RNA polymerase sigma factor [Acidimicrobiales bacterium]
MTTVAVGPVARAGRSDDVDMARDQSLIARAQAGDKAAFDELYVHYSRRLYRLCLRRLGDAHEAQDVAQEAFVRAWRALPRFCGERRFYPWLSVIATNRCTDVLRKRSRSTPVAEFYGADPTSGEELDEALMARVDAEMAGCAYARLTERHRRILALREGSGMSYQAIAEHEGVAISAVETLLWRARQALKREFAALAGAERHGAVIGLGALAGALHQLVRVPAHVAKRLGQLSPASATVALGSVAAATAVALGTTHPAPAPELAPAPAAALGPQSLAPQSLGPQSLGQPGAPGASSSVEGPAGVVVTTGSAAGWGAGAAGTGPTGPTTPLADGSGAGRGGAGGVTGPSPAPSTAAGGEGGSGGLSGLVASASGSEGRGGAVGSATGALAGTVGAALGGAGSAVGTTVTTGVGTVVSSALSGVGGAVAPTTASAGSALSSTASTASSALGAVTKAAA